MQKINICMLLELRYRENMQVYPTHEILSYITNFGHEVTWILSSDEIKDVKKTTFCDVNAFVLPTNNPKSFLRIFAKTINAYKRTCFLFKIIEHEKYNIIFVRNGIFDGFLALYIKKRYNIPFVFQIDNPLEQSWETYKFYSKHKNFWYFILKLEKFLVMYILHNANLIFPISKWLKDDFSKKGIMPSKMVPLPEGINPYRFMNTNEIEIRKRNRLEDSKIVIYIGTLDKMRHLEVLIHAFSKVKAFKKNIKLLMVGDGTDKSNLEKLSKELGINDDVLFTGHVHFKNVPDFIAAADVGVSAVPPLDFYKLSSPIKILEYMAMAKPVVANEEIPDHKEIIEQSGGGILVKFEVVSFAEGIIKSLNNPEELVKMGEKGRMWVQKNRSYEYLARKVEKAYITLIQNN